jgi:hypothetical protein
MSLKTGKKITRRTWNELPITQPVIDRVNALGSDQPEHFTFTDRHGRLIGDIEFTGVDAEITGVHADEPDDAQLLEEEPVIDDGIEIPGVGAEATAPQIVEIDDLDTTYVDPARIEVETVQEEETDEEEQTPVKVESAQEETVNEAQAPFEPRRSTRVRSENNNYIPSMQGSSYEYPETHLFVQEENHQSEPEVVAAIMMQISEKAGVAKTGVALTQLSLKSGLKEWGDRGWEAARSEMKQLHLRDTFKPKHWHELSVIERGKVLESHMFLKEKRSGKIKGRTVAGGNKQRDYISKEDSSSPTVSTESVLLTCIIDAEEQRDTAVVDIPNAFIQTRVEKKEDMVFIKLRGVLVDILVEIAPEYGPYVTTDKKGVKQLIVQCQNAIYGTMVASLLYYRKFVKSLTDIGFVVNPYDPCVANKIIEGKQMTICFHVDDCKLSHKKTKVVDRIIEYLRQEYESIFEDGSGEMTVSRGKIHKYLGMTIDYTVPGQVKITMLDYVEEILTAFEEAEPKASGTKSSAAPENLFTVNEDCEKLPPDKSEKYHTIVAKILWATKRARPDTCTAIAFLTTRVREPDTDDWAKLTHLIKYIRGTRSMPLILGADGTGAFGWWVDAAFAVHPNMRGHTGGGLSMGLGFPIVGSTKQKINTRSSTEAELVGADDFMSVICWTRYFMKAQGYDVSDNILFQDNQSAILLEKNGKASSSKRTKHINIRYFFITDRVKNKEVSIVWCPTEDMTGDYATKPLQGALFRKFRDQIMGVVPAAYPGPGKVKPSSGKKSKPKKGESSVAPSAGPQECLEGYGFPRG